jgi:hypothetical protein
MPVGPNKAPQMLHARVVFLSLTTSTDLPARWVAGLFGYPAVYWLGAASAVLGAAVIVTAGRPEALELTAR